MILQTKHLFFCGLGLESENMEKSLIKVDAFEDWKSSLVHGYVVMIEAVLDWRGSPKTIV